MGAGWEGLKAIKKGLVVVARWEGQLGGREGDEKKE